MDKRNRKGRGRTPVFDSDYEDIDEPDVKHDIKQERAVRYGSRDDDDGYSTQGRGYHKFKRLRGRIGPRNSEKKKRYSYWENRDRQQRDDRHRGNYGYEWDKTFKRTDPRHWKRSRRERYRRNDGHPLDPLNDWQHNDRAVSRRYDNRRRGGYYYNGRGWSNGRRYNNRYNNRRYRYNNRQNGYSSSNRSRTDRHSLDTDLDSYFSKSSRHNRRQLDSDIDGYMMQTKKGLDDNIDQYMKTKQKPQSKKRIEAE